ncbi:glycine cleavage system protein GcvH, partial [Dehalococcoidia bacterium]|nr:glycine cleavage system protein GcvH [Dehalococcoidia bacterium]MCL0101825.1 glycine cleavage system protein GcvH [Dehalococcoidia bacterium]
MYPEDLRYYKEHQWVRLENPNTGVIGITFFAQEELGDVVYVQLPSVGTQIKQFAKFGEIESVKSVSDLFSPVSGEVVEINPRLSTAPELVNLEPYGSGWMMQIRLEDSQELSE